MAETAAAARARARRERILEAAERCFAGRGFEAARMAEIAAAAGVSAGLIYRYFRGKDEIIVAIIDRQLARLRAELAQLDCGIDLAGRLVRAACPAGGGAGGAPALVLEMSAAANRVPAIASALQAFDAALRQDLARLLARPRRRGGYGVPARQARARALALQCVVDGLRMRAVREPGLDRALLRRSVEALLPALVGRVH